MAWCREFDSSIEQSSRVLIPCLANVFRSSITARKGLPTRLMDEDLTPARPAAVQPTPLLLRVATYGFSAVAVVLGLLTELSATTRCALFGAGCLSIQHTWALASMVGALGLMGIVHRRMRPIAGAAGLLWLLKAAVVWWFAVGVFSTERFDANVWRSRSSANFWSTCFRGSMAADVRAAAARPGTPKGDVLRQLGEPDSASGTQLDFVLGRCSSAVSLDVLQVYFDPQGVVFFTAIGKMSGQ